MDYPETITISPVWLKFFHLLFLLYPQEYRQRFETEMQDLFSDMYVDEMKEHGHLTAQFVFQQIVDSTQSVFDQHLQVLGKKGVKRFIQETFNVTIYAVIGFLLMIPFLTIFSLDMIVVFFTGNRHALQSLYMSWFWKIPILPIWLLGFPIVGILINLFPLLQSINKITKVKFWTFMVENSATLFVLSLGISILFLVFGHDIIPCIVTQFLRSPLLLPRILAICKNA